MSAKIICKSKDPETGVCTFVYSQSTPSDKNRVVEFTAPYAELETWFKSASTIEDMTDAPFKTGPGIFDHPVISFCLFSLVMMVGGNEDLVGAEFNVTATRKVQP